VTGYNISDIDGTLRTNGNANLYLINPNGIIFGANAKLDIAGSFTASTANSIKFSDGSEFSATNPQAPPLLQVNVPLGLQLGKSEIGATITNRGNLATGQDLTLTADQLDLQSRLQAGRDLTLQAQDVVKIRDAAINPLVLTSGRDMRIQGNQSVDIFALNHLQTQILSGRNLSLISNADISGDAHFSSGGNLSFLTTTGAVGNFVSKYDPIIYANGDVIFGDYTGAALKVEAMGSIQGGDITILFPDTSGSIPLSDPDFTMLTTSPSLILRAGVVSVPFANIPLTTGGTIFSSSVLVGNQVGSITVSSIDTSSLFSDAGSVLLSSRNGNINTRNGLINASSFLGLGGEVTLTAGQDILSGNIDTSSPFSDAGSVLLSSRNGNINTRNGLINASSFLGLSGQVTLTAGQDILSGSIDTSSLDSNAGNVSLLSLNGNIDTRSGMVNASSFLGLGGKVILTAVEDVKVGNVLTFGKSGGDIAINSRSISVVNSALSSSAFGQGNAGNITFTATGLVSFDGGGVFSLLEASAVGKAGDITVKTGSLIVKNGAQLLTYTKGQGNAGNINVTATDSVLFSGLGSGAFTTMEDGAVGDAGNVNINAKSVSVTDRAQLVSSTLGHGNAGNITINASDSVSFSNYSAVFSDVKSGAVGNGGNVTINARSLSITDSAQLLTDTYGHGNAGNVKIVATDSVFLSGVDANLYHSAISSSTRSNFGNGGLISINTNSMNINDGAFLDSSTFSNKIGGNIEINAQNLHISNDGQISSAAINTGNAGNITINLGQSLILDGVGSKITAKTDVNSSGNGGSIFIDPPLVSITNGAEISVNSLGTGAGGNLQIIAGKFVFANNALLSATTASGEGGNINLQIADIFFPRKHSQITATAGKNGNGGNITLSALFLVSVPSENNDIFANAFFGKGGNLNITTQGILGFQFPPRPTPLSDITASSEFGIQGTININTPGIDPSKGLSNLPVDVSDPSRLVTQRCIADQRGSEFIITGKGGVPANPSDRPTDTGVLDNFGTLPDLSQTTNLTSSATPQPTSTPDVIVEATGWIVNAQNQVVLVAGKTPAQPNIRCPR
jgi:large exoprotein involved in heme utilization and adhesion